MSAKVAFINFYFAIKERSVSFKMFGEYHTKSAVPEYRGIGRNSAERGSGTRRCSRNKIIDQLINDVDAKSWFPHCSLLQSSKNQLSGAAPNFYYERYRHWNALNDLRRVIHKNENGDTFEVELSRTVSKMLEVFNNSF